MKSPKVSVVIIRDAEPSEADLLTTLARRSKASWGYSPEFMLACQDELTYTSEEIESPAYCFVVAEVTGRCVGFYALVRLTQDETELEALFVEPAHIGKGYGRELIEHAKAAAAANGASRLIIQGDPNAARFYEAAGGVVIGQRESDSIQGRYLPLYAIDLAGANAA